AARRVSWIRRETRPRAWTQDGFGIPLRSDFQYAGTIGTLGAMATDPDYDQVRERRCSYSSHSVCSPAWRNRRAHIHCRRRIGRSHGSRLASTRSVHDSWLGQSRSPASGELCRKRYSLITIPPRVCLGNNTAPRAVSLLWQIQKRRRTDETLSSYGLGADRSSPEDRLRHSGGLSRRSSVDSA